MSVLALDRHPIREVPAYRSPFEPKAFACRRPDGKCGYEVACDLEKRCVDMSLTFVDGASPISLKKLEADIFRKPLDEIAAAVRKLTYAEMLEFVEGLWAVSDSNITNGTLPAILHRWSVSRK